MQSSSMCPSCGGSGQMVSNRPSNSDSNGSFQNYEIDEITPDMSFLEMMDVLNQKLIYDEYILSAGTWTSKLCKQLGIDLLLQAGKGYSINHSSKTEISCPAILVEPKCAITPMNGFTRYSGTMEISSINNRIRKNRVNAICDAVESFYPSVKIPTTENHIPPFFSKNETKGFPNFTEK